MLNVLCSCFTFHPRHEVHQLFDFILSSKMNRSCDEMHSNGGDVAKNLDFRPITGDSRISSYEYETSDCAISDIFCGDKPPRSPPGYFLAVEKWSRLIALPNCSRMGS